MKRPRASRAEVIAALTELQRGASIEAVARSIGRPASTVWNWRAGRSHGPLVQEFLAGRDPREVFPPLSSRHPLTEIDEERRRAHCESHQRLVRIQRGKTGWECRANHRSGRWAGIHGASWELFHEMNASQGGVCAICGGINSDRALAMDHCHTTGVIRGLLCTRCNTAIGAFRDDPELLLRAVDYIRDSRSAA